MTLRTTNLNLLPVLRALLTEGSITRAAAVLHLSQPATSSALGRLRELLGDPLLVQVGRTMHLTPRAERLRPVLDNVCNAIELMLLDAEFLPAATQRNFVIATSDYMALLLGPALIATFTAKAPGVTVSFIGAPENLVEQLVSGAIDVAIIARTESFAKNLSIKAGYMDRMVAVVASNHPLAEQSTATLAELDAWPMLGVNTDIQRIPVAFSLLRMIAGHAGPLRFSVSHLMLLPMLAARSECVTVVPKALAECVAQMMPINLLELTSGQTALELCLLWSPLYDADMAHRWLRDELDRVMREHFDTSAES